MNRTMRRLLTTAGATVTGLALLAGTASAHFCSFAAPANSRITQGAGWNTGDELVSAINMWTAEWPDSCDEAVAAVIAQVEELADDGYVFKGPGLLAGGTLRQGGANTPDHFAYLTSFFAVPEHCFEH